MDARNIVQWTVAVLIIIGGFCLPTFANLIYTYSGDFNLPIPAPDINDPYISWGWMDDAVIDITEHIPISDLDVCINVTHTNVIDLQISLQGPDDKKIYLNIFDVSDLNKFPRDENYKDFKDTIFDDEAEILVAEGEAPFTGRFKPIEPYKLSEFDGEDAYGPWHLQIYDVWQADTGTLDSFELIITTPEPTPLILLMLGAGSVMLFKPPRRR
jgi:subtilisin-like proprotein convertase family protein